MQTLINSTITFLYRISKIDKGILKIYDCNHKFSLMNSYSTAMLSATIHVSFPLVVCYYLLY